MQDKCVVCYAMLPSPRLFQGASFLQVCSEECEQVLIDDINAELSTIAEAEAESASQFQGE